MTDHASFLAAIVAAPDDDLPRMQMADWLDEPGSHFDPERAEFIRVQCELAKRGYLGFNCTPDPTNGVANALRRRERELLNANSVNGGQWAWAALPRECHGDVYCWHVEFVRGFLCQFILSWADWTRHATALLAACPLRGRDGCVRLTTWPGERQLVDITSRDNRHPTIGQRLAAEWPNVRFELPVEHLGDFGAGDAETLDVSARVLPDGTVNPLE